MRNRKVFINVSRMALGISLFTFIGCASRQPAELRDARLDLIAAKDDTFVMKNAPVELREAEKTIKQAELMWEEGAEEEKVVDLAEAAENQIVAARTIAGKRATSELEDDIELQKKLNRANQAAYNAQDEADRMMDVAAIYKTEAERAKAERAQLMSELQARETEKGLLLTMGSDVLFEVDRADLTNGGQRELALVSSYLKKMDAPIVTVEGHTDNVGDANYNRELSLKRAQAVKYFLIRQGVAPSQIVTKGMGEKFPIATNDNSAGRLKNRRVDILIAPDITQTSTRTSSRHY